MKSIFCDQSVFNAFLTVAKFLSELHQGAFKMHDEG